MSAQDVERRRREVAESACDNAACDMCAHYIATGTVILKPATREEFERSMRRAEADQ